MTTPDQRIRKDYDDLFHRLLFNDEYIKNWQKSYTLEGFEKVLGRKFNSTDFNIFGKEYPTLCEKTKAEIKLKDREIEETKIDTHPRYFIKEEMMYYIPEEPISQIYNNFRPPKIQFKTALIKLELIL